MGFRKVARAVAAPPPARAGGWFIPVPGPGAGSRAPGLPVRPASCRVTARLAWQASRSRPFLAAVLIFEIARWPVELPTAIDVNPMRIAIRAKGMGIVRPKDRRYVID